MTSFLLFSSSSSSLLLFSSLLTCPFLLYYLVLSMLNSFKLFIKTKGEEPDEGPADRRTHQRDGRDVHDGLATKRASVQGYYQTEEMIDSILLNSTQLNSTQLKGRTDGHRDRERIRRHRSFVCLLVSGHRGNLEHRPFDCGAHRRSKHRSEQHDSMVSQSLQRSCWLWMTMATYVDDNDDIADDIADDDASNIKYHHF